MSYQVEITDDQEHGYGAILIATHNSKRVVEEYDHGEPEDNSFYRDYSWIKKALLDAYAAGLSDYDSLFKEKGCKANGEPQDCDSCF